MILWLTARSFSTALRTLIARTLLASNCSDSRMAILDLSNYATQYREFNWGAAAKSKIELRKRQFAVLQLQKALHCIIAKLHPSVIACDDMKLLEALEQRALPPMNACGSVFWFENLPLVSCLYPTVLHNGGNTEFIERATLAKIARYSDGKQRRQPRFDYTLVEDLIQAKDFCSEAEQAKFLSVDIETNGTSISCIGHTYLRNDGSTKTFVVPLIDKRRPENGYRYWSKSGEALVIEGLKHLQNSAVPKIMQNGWYDSAYLLRAEMPPRNYFIDTMNMQHALFSESSKKLGFLAAVYLDYVVWWKDDIKGEREAASKITEEAYQRYWQYNGLDTYYTLLVGLRQLEEFTRRTYAYANYDTTFRLSIGPCSFAGMMGCPIDKESWGKSIPELKDKCNAAYESLQNLVSPHERIFNPRSSRQVGYFLYDFLGAKQTRLQKRMPKKYGKYSTDVDVLKIIREDANPFIHNFLDRMERYKKAAEVLSFFGNWNKFTYEDSGRTLEWLNACGTETGRMSSGHSQFWCGGNGQNISAKLRPWFCAPKDYVILDIDYSASDDRFVAYEAEDPVKIDLVESGKDPHCFHTSMFFGYPYEQIKAAHDAEEPWVDDSEIGIRPATKRVGHGKNYGAGAKTVYEKIGRKGVIHAAKALGYKDADAWSYDKLLKIVEQLCDKYDNPKTGIYRRLVPWHAEIVRKAAADHGIVRNVFGFTRQFLGRLDDPKTQREIAAHYGQGDTAGNSNRALLKIFYGNICDVNCLFFKQVHDSLCFFIHRDHISEKVSAIKQIMELPITIHGRTFRVPADAKVGLFWGKHMLSWTEDVTFSDVLKYNDKQFHRLPTSWGNDVSVEVAQGADDTTDLSSLEDELASVDFSDAEAAYDPTLIYEEEE